jgi:hypothetical protein
MADHDWDSNTFYAYKENPWVTRQYQPQDPSFRQSHDFGRGADASLPPRPLNSAKEAMLACFAHLTIEQERWGLDTTDAESLRCLQDMKSITWKDMFRRGDHQGCALHGKGGVVAGPPRENRSPF